MIAAARLKAEKLQWWWCKHYNRPLKDPILATYTLEELQIEHLMYAIEENPMQAYPQCDMGKVQFKTGDPLIDDWEKKLAEGRDSEIDWDAGVDQDFLKRFKTYSKRVAMNTSSEAVEQRLLDEAVANLPKAEHDEFLASLVGGFNDDYTETSK